MPQPMILNFLIHAGEKEKRKKKKNLLSKLFYLREVYWFHESKSSLTRCRIYSSIPADLSLIQSWLIQHMECSEGVINVVFVCCEEKQRERSQDTRNKTHYHSQDKRGWTWGTCLQVHACCFLTKTSVCNHGGWGGLTALTADVSLCLCVAVFTFIFYYFIYFFLAKRFQ